MKYSIWHAALGAALGFAVLSACGPTAEDRASQEQERRLSEGAQESLRQWSIKTPPTAAGSANVAVTPGTTTLGATYAQEHKGEAGGRVDPAAKGWTESLRNWSISTPQKKGK